MIPFVFPFFGKICSYKYFAITFLRIKGTMKYLEKRNIIFVATPCFGLYVTFTHAVDRTWMSPSL